MANTYFQLPPHQGGQRFGPFAGGIVQVGTHPTNCQIVLQSQGMMPVHAQITDNGDGQYTVSAADRAGPVFVMQAGDPQLWPVQGPVLAKPGDTVVFVQQHGPALTIQTEAQVQAAAGPPSTAQRAGGFAGSMQKEMSRQAHARLMHRNRWYRDAYNYYYRFRTGSLTSPRVLVPLIGGVITAIGSGFVACAGGILALLQLMSG